MLDTLEPMFDPAISRRGFLRVSALAGGGLALSLTLPVAADAAEAAEPVHLTDFVTIDPAGLVTITSKNPEIGQGIKTSMAMMIADELDADWAKVAVASADFNKARYGNQIAGGSFATTNEYLPMRLAGAAARSMLVQAAANASGLAASELTTSKGAVRHAASGRAWSYGELAGPAALLPPPKLETLKLKEPKDFAIIGKATRGVDSARVLRGEPLFGIDARFPGMLHAVIETPPAHGGRLKSVDTKAAEAAHGVVSIVRLAAMGGPQGMPDGVAVVATNHWYAEKARELLKAEWDLGASQGDSLARFDSEATRLHGLGPAAASATEIRRDGDPTAGLVGAAKRIKARYTYPWIAHATLEPQNCTALYRDGALEIWAPTQSPMPGVDQIGKLLGIPADKVTLHITRIGGGFGRRLANDYMLQAAAVAKAIPGRPVQVLWNRAEDLKRDFFRPGGWHMFEAGVDKAGKLTTFTDHFVTYGGGDGNPHHSSRLDGTHFPADLVPNLSYRMNVLDTVIPMGPLRAPASNALAFAFQGFLDEVAEAAGKDLPALMMELCAGEGMFARLETSWAKTVETSRARVRGVIERVVGISGWDKRPRGHDGRGLGFGFYFSHRGYVAEVADVSVDGTDVKVNKVWAAVDVGNQIINPTGAEAQVTGAIIDGIGQALAQKIGFTDGAIEQRNFDTFPLVRIGAAPSEIEVSWVMTDNPPTGLGEPALPPVVPAVTNAIYAASGKRIRSLPLSELA